MQIKSFVQGAKKIFFGEHWTDLFIQWLHGLPLPYWLACIILGLLVEKSIILLNNEYSFQNKLQVSSFVFTLPYGLYILWQIKKDKRNLASNFEKIQQQTPIKLLSFFTWVSGWLRVSFVLGILLLLSIGVTTDSFKDTRLLQFGYILLVMVTINSLNTTIILASRILQILSAIYKLRSQKINIELFDLFPIYNLSKITQRIALYLLPLSIAFELSVVPYYASGTLTFPEADPFSLTITAFGPLLTILAGLIFATPVFWIRKRIIEAKSNTLAEIDRKLKISFSNQDQYAEQGN